VFYDLSHLSFGEFCHSLNDVTVHLVLNYFTQHTKYI